MIGGGRTSGRGCLVRKTTSTTPTIAWASSEQRLSLLGDMTIRQQRRYDHGERKVDMGGRCGRRGVE